jgi:hypothetical protein
MTIRYLALLVLLLVICGGCRATVAVSVGGDADAIQEAGKDYGKGNSFDPTLDLSLQ